MTLLNLFWVFLLIAASGFFVAAEFAIVKVRDSRIEQLIHDGNKKAVAAKKIIHNLDGYLSACQLGITLTALALGWIGKPAVANLINPVIQYFGLPTAVAEGISFVIGFATISFLHVVVGELAPKTLAIQRAEQVTLTLSPSLILFYKIAYPAIWLLNGSARQVIKLMGLHAMSEHQPIHSEEEIRMILLQSHEGGEISQTELQLARNSLHFADRVAGEVMVPRTDMTCLYTNLPWQDNLKTITEEKYARYPVCDGDKDRIIGFINTKDLCFSGLKDLTLLSMESFLKQSLRQPIVVTELTPIDEILKRMQRKHLQMAIVEDEYGGTSGLLTIEDILEEIVGEIQDEHDEERNAIENLGDGRYSLDARMPIADFNVEFDLALEAKGVFTLGGWFIEESHKMPEQGQRVIYENIQFSISELEKNTIRRIDMEFLKQPSEN
ncbi:hemolysin family protein [Desulforamulus aeronauticus]|uniref:Hemolysin, contains CBS domains n=1 Tax=Desulforamulus aeronauticus DSM 10349 TaxID=1121421 RepID=A0A1M6S5Z1_9FIRM|nr:hemolysin family protein [Desulforamulus aeronauticus]SHK40163.1 Hemolysin, contains CBS domains [Desulforamulus aeronauticus DSM 10349]